MRFAVFFFVGCFFFCVRDARAACDGADAFGVVVLPARLETAAAPEVLRLQAARLSGALNSVDGMHAALLDDCVLTTTDGPRATDEDPDDPVFNARVEAWLKEESARHSEEFARCTERALAGSNARFVLVLSQQRVSTFGELYNDQTALGFQLVERCSGGIVSAGKQDNDEPDIFLQKVGNNTLAFAAELARTSPPPPAAPPPTEPTPPTTTEPTTPTTTEPTPPTTEPTPPTTEPTTEPPPPPPKDPWVSFGWPFRSTTQAVIDPLVLWVVPGNTKDADPSWAGAKGGAGVRLGFAGVSGGVDILTPLSLDTPFDNGFDLRLSARAELLHLMFKKVIITPQIGVDEVLAALPDEDVGDSSSNPNRNSVGLLGGITVRIPNSRALEGLVDVMRFSVDYRYSIANDYAPDHSVIVRAGLDAGGFCDEMLSDLFD